MVAVSGRFMTLLPHLNPARNGQSGVGRVTRLNAGGGTGGKKWSLRVPTGDADAPTTLLPIPGITVFPVGLSQDIRATGQPLRGAQGPALPRCSDPRAGTQNLGGAHAMPTLTLAEIDVLLEAERGFPRSVASLAEINRLLDARLLCGTEESRSPSPK